MNKVLISGLLGVILSFSAYAQTTQPEEEKSAADLSYAMGKSLDPEVYMNLFKQMMANPFGLMTSPMATCAQCHQGEELARYQKSMGPMMQMMNPGNWMNPGAYQQMMTAPMDPKAYTEWYDAYMRKFGGMMGMPQSETE